MPDTPAVDDLVGAVSDALRGDRATINTIASNLADRTRTRVAQALGARGVPAVTNSPPPAPPRPVREVELRLANGRRVRARIAPSLARRADLARLAATIDQSDRRTSDALNDLDRRVAVLNRKVDVAMLGILRGIGVGTEQLQQVQQVMDLLPVRAPIQAASSVVNSVQAVAYGDKGSIFTTNNLLLAGTQLFWSLLEPVLQGIGVLSAESGLIVAALAPLGTLVTGGALLGERQHERFLTGVLMITGGDVATQSLRAQIGEAHWPSFRDRTDVPVTLAVIDPPGFPAARLVARVRAGTVEVVIVPLFAADGTTLRPPKGTVQVAWTVDTGADIG